MFENQFNENLKLLSKYPKSSSPRLNRWVLHVPHWSLLMLGGGRHSAHKADAVCSNGGDRYGGVLVVGAVADANMADPSTRI